MNDRDLIPDVPPVVQWGLQHPGTGIAVEADYDDGLLTLSVNPLDTDPDAEVNEALSWCHKLSGHYPSYREAEAALRAQGVTEFRE